MATNIDALDYAILSVLDREELWKQAIHDRLEAEQACLPIEAVPAVQTTGRRVDKLQYAGYVENTIIKPDNMGRDLAIAYRLTEQGKQAIAETRTALLKREVKQHIFPEDCHQSLSKQALVGLLQDEFGLNDAMAQRLAQYDRNELVTFLTIRYARKNAVDVLDRGHLEKYEDILAEHQDIAAALDIDPV